LHDSHRFQAHRDDLTDEAYDILLVIGPVRVARDPGARVGVDLILVNNPFQRGAIAELIVEDFGRNAFEREELVIKDSTLVGCEPHLLHAPV
jgi:hypothetical protein